MGKILQTRELAKREKGFGLYLYPTKVDVSGNALPADAKPGAVMTVDTGGGGTVGGLTVAQNDVFFLNHDDTCVMLHDDSDT
jgi:hypothetical protein